MPTTTGWTPSRRLALRAVALAHRAGMPVRLSNATDPLGAWAGAAPLGVHWRPLGWLNEQGLVERLGGVYPANEQFLPTSEGVREARRLHPDLFPGSTR
jgi:hypothetical protein